MFEVNEMKCQEEMVLYMHEYLDEYISPEDEKVLKQHLMECKSCQLLFQELEKTNALLQSTAVIHAPSDFTNQVMSQLPKQKKKINFQLWFTLHPVLTAASLFLILMMGSVVTTWSTGKELSVSKQSNLIVQKDTVIVPENEIIKGDVVVKNGNLKIEGKVEGNVTVINGSIIDPDQLLASAGNVTGNIEEIDQIFAWMWFHIKSFFSNSTQIFNKDTQSISPLNIAV